jgi:methylmalonyl-CoA mutase C-terminal domain/subunit
VEHLEEKIRVLIAKPGLDGHDRGALVIAQALRDAGMEVIYTGLRQTPAQIVKAALQEDVDVIGLSSLSGAHNVLFPEVMRLLQEEGADDIFVIGGGVIPEDDIPHLLEKGIKKIFTPGTSTRETIDFIRSEVHKKKRGRPTPPTKIDHIGIAVKDLSQAISFFENILGLKVTGTEVVESEKVKVAFLPIGETRIELLEATDHESPIAKFIERRGEGIHHIALQVDDVDGNLKYLDEKGVGLIHKNAKRGSHNSEIAFIHPKSTFGVLLELMKPGETHE